MGLSIPQYTGRERLADGIVHVLGVTASIIGASVLLAIAFASLPAATIVSSIIYSVGLVTVFVLSAAYNLATSHRLKSVLRRFDHAAIYIKIAATYTPFALLKLVGWPGAGLLAFVWIIAALGATIKLWIPGRLFVMSYVLYLGQGWAGVVLLSPLTSALSNWTLLLLGIGGVLYTVGVIFHLWISLRYHNAIWHAFVLAGSSCHYLAVWNAVANT